MGDGQKPVGQVRPKGRDQCSSLRIREYCAGARLLVERFTMNDERFRSLHHAKEYLNTVARHRAYCTTDSSVRLRSEKAAERANGGTVSPSAWNDSSENILERRVAAAPAGTTQFAK